jgi:hypothetical protein
VRPPVSSLKSTALTTVCKMAIVFGFADCLYFVYRVLSLQSYLFDPTSSTAFSFLCHFFCPITVMVRKRVTADELKAPKRIATKEVHMEKKTVLKLATGMWTWLSRIKIRHWIIPYTQYCSTRQGTLKRKASCVPGLIFELVLFLNRTV